MPAVPGETEYERRSLQLQRRRSSNCASSDQVHHPQLRNNPFARLDVRRRLTNAARHLGFRRNSLRNLHAADMRDVRYFYT